MFAPRIDSRLVSAVMNSWTVTDWNKNYSYVFDLVSKNNMFNTKTSLFLVQTLTKNKH